MLNLPALALGFSVQVVGSFFIVRGLWSIFIHSNCRLPLWCDLLFGTYHCPNAEERFELGLPEPIPLGYFTMLFGIAAKRPGRIVSRACEMTASERRLEHL